MISSHSKFSDRVYIPHKYTRTLLHQFCTSGISKEELLHLKELTSVHSPSLIPLLSLLVRRVEGLLACKPKLQCCSEWCDLLKALATSSPVCALVQPSEATITLLRKMCECNITKDVAAMENLQKAVPVLFSLLRCSKHNFPQEVLTPILQELMKKALIPFSDDHDEHWTTPPNDTAPDNLSYFPKLPRIRQRGFYHADTSSKTTTIVCTKKRIGHPSLLPGCFTLFCKHG